MVGGLALASLASCQSVLDPDENNPQVPDPTPASQAYFLAISVFDMDDSNSRTAFDSNYDDVSMGSDTFNKGLYSERAICPIDDFEEPEKGPHFMLFFDKNGVLHDNKLYITDWEKSQDGEYYNAYATMYKAINGNGPELNFEEGQIMIILNANPVLCEKINEALNDNTGEKNTYSYISKLTVGNPENTDYLYFDYKGTRYFTMSSSMVIKDNLVVPANIPDDEGYIWYESKELAKRHPYSMYVERIQSKYTLILSKNNIKYYFGTPDEMDPTKYNPIDQHEPFIFEKDKGLTPLDEFEELRYVKEYNRSRSMDLLNEVDVKTTSDWKVNIAGWGVNGLEKKEYLFKNLTPSDEFYSLQDWWCSLFTDNYRNYWAEGCDYLNVSYPDQYRKAEDNTSLTGYKDVSSSLIYLPYKNLRHRSAHLYSPEHTFNVNKIFEGKDKEKILNSKEHLRASTHVIIDAQLIIKGLDSDEVYRCDKVNNNSHVIKATTALTETTDVICKIYMDGIYWAEDAYKEFVAEYLGYCMLSEENQKLENFGPNDGILYSGISTDPSNKQPCHNSNFESVAVNIEGGDGYVRIQPRQGVRLYTYDINKKIRENGEEREATEREKYTEVTDKFNNLALAHPEYFGGHYYFGRMYYSIPVKHNTTSSSFTSNSTTPGILTGDYGSVRNHWYNFTITGVNSPGIPVADPDQPIIPNNEPLYETLKVNMEILRWHNVSTDVSIDDQLRQ